MPILAILLGMIVSQAYIYAFLIKYLLMLMLFFPFLKISTKTFHPHALWIVLANIVIANTVYLIILPFNSELAFLCFITAITPTATAAPAVMDFLQGNVEYVVSSVLLTNSIIGLTIPLLLSWQGKRTLFLQCLRHKGFSYYLVLLLKFKTLAT
ncbi:MAG: hypothetical protein WBM44_11325 [Waterburya sp.]